MPLTRWLRVLISLLSLATVISLTRDICIACSGSVEARYVGCPGIIALRLGNKTSTLGSHNSTVAGKNSGVLGPGIALKDDIMMAAAIFSTPVILHLLRTDALKEQNMVVALVVSGLYVLASLAMNVLNKKAAKAFEGTCLLVILQMLVSVVVIICMEHSNMKLDKCTDFLKWLIVPFAFSGMLGTSMFAFKKCELDYNLDHEEHTTDSDVRVREGSVQPASVCELESGRVVADDSGWHRAVRLF
mmetsp:Transcript_105979/g.295843  ORF Transcript_105979/g.295843 Transcript_105979/m.295843 type:complete len:245 (-) Transcript_105979:570-1304(-)